jgi:hypothetical protein
MAKCGGGGEEEEEEEVDGGGKEEKEEEETRLNTQYVVGIEGSEKEKDGRRG